MKFRQLIATTALLALTSSVIAESCDDLRDIGDTLTFAIPLTAMVVTSLKHDWQGAGQHGYDTSSRTHRHQ